MGVEITRTEAHVLRDINRIATARAALYRRISGMARDAGTPATDRQRRQLEDFDLETERLYAELRRIRCGPKQGPGSALQRYVNRPSRLCSIPGCDQKHYAKGYCSKHWQRWRSNGDPYLAKRPRTPRSNLPATSPYRRGAA